MQELNTGCWPSRPVLMGFLELSDLSALCRTLAFVTVLFNGGKLELGWRWLGGLEHLLLFQRTQIWFPASTSLLTTEAAGNLIPLRAPLEPGCHTVHRPVHNKTLCVGRPIILSVSVP